jgi:hypothetical protein
LDDRTYPVNEGVVVADLGTGGSMHPMNAQAQIRIAGEITFGNVSIFEGKPVIRTLIELATVNKRLLELFVEYCKATKRCP